MNPAFWLALSFYVIAALWTVFVAWPFMRTTKRAAVEGLAASNRLARLLAAVDLDRLERLLAAAEKLLVRPPARHSEAVPLPPDETPHP